MSASDTQSEVLTDVRTKVQRNWKVVLLNDEEHSYDYVVMMLVAVCAMSREQAFRCAVEVDLTGRTIVFFGGQEDCAKISAKINNYGADHRLVKSRGSMRSSVEPA